MNRMARWLVLCSLLTATIAVVSCDDPQQAAMKIFTSQGLVLLEPARDYIKPGGLVVLPSKGRPDYLDPLDDLGTDAGTQVNFKSIIEGQKQDTSTALDVALGLIGKLIKVPAGLKYDGGQTVELDQISSGGERLLSPKVLALLQKPATSGFLKSQLGARNRTFIVQEIYTATSLSLKTTSNKALDVTYGTGGNLPDCSSASPSSSDGKSSSQKPSSGGTATGSPTTGTNNASSNDQPSTKNGNSSTGGSGNKSGKTTGNSQGISVGACKNTQYELTLKSDAAIPFAVRLNEVVVDKGGDLQIKYGSFKFPSDLGSSEVEKQTALIDQNNSPLAGIQRMKRPK